MEPHHVLRSKHARCLMSKLHFLECSTYSYVSNKRACAFILFETFMQPCTALFEPARLLIVEVTILPARLLKPAPFWILLLVFSKKCRNCYQIVAATQVQQPRTNFDKKSLINLIFSAYLLETHLPCTII